MTGRVVDSYTNMHLVKLFSHTDREADYAKSAMDPFLKTVYTQMRYATGLDVAVDISNYALTFIVGGLAIYLWSTDAITVGAIAVAISLVLRISAMSHWVMWEISSLFENIGTVVDGAATLSNPITVVDKKDAQELQVTEGKIEYRNVSFHYGKGGGIIDDFNLEVTPGEKVGLVGRSGAGKSTLMNLLLRFHDIEQGEILVDGQNIAIETSDAVVNKKLPRLFFAEDIADIQRIQG